MVSEFLQAYLDTLDGGVREWLCGVKAAALLPRSVRLRCCEFAIAAAGEAACVDAVYLGEGMSLDYYLGLYGGTVLRERQVLVSELARTVEEVRRRCGVAIVEVNRMLRAMLPAGGWMSAPWIRQEIDLEGARYAHRRRGIERSHGQKVRRNGLRYTLSKSAADLTEFYFDYYVPYLVHRHGAGASVRSLSGLRRGLERGFLVQVWQEGEWASGLLVTRPSVERYRLLAVGLHPSRFERNSAGAVAANYYYLVREAAARGVRYVDFCGSRPHVLNGLYRHKWYWGAEPVLEPSHHAMNVFFVETGLELPAVVGGQLVWSGEAWGTLADACGTMGRTGSAAGRNSWPQMNADERGLGVRG